MHASEERKLVKKARSDPKAFGDLYDIHFNPIFNYVFRRVADFDTARDITSEVFISAYRNLWQFQWKNISIGAWFYRIATNEVNQFFRKKQYRGESSMDLQLDHFLSLADPASLDSERAAAEQQLANNQEFIRVQAIIKDLPVKYQEVLTLRYFEDKTTKEISRILNKREGTVKSLLSRGLGKIRKSME